MNALVRRAAMAAILNAAVGAMVLAAVVAASAQVRIPEACISLAKRNGYPRILNAEQTTAALASLQQLDDADPIVRRCREAVIALIAAAQSGGR